MVTMLRLKYVFEDVDPEFEVVISLVDGSSGRIEHFQSVGFSGGIELLDLAGDSCRCFALSVGVSYHGDVVGLARGFECRYAFGAVIRVVVVG